MKNNRKSIGAFSCFVFFCMLFINQALAEKNKIKMTSTINGKNVFCDASGVGLEVPKKEWSNLVGWCIKACEIHGFKYADMANKDQFDSDYESDPKLPSDYWTAAEKTTPSQCLPYEPITKISMKAKCMPYSNIVEVTGMLSNYPGLGLGIKSPQPNCIDEDRSDRIKMPGAKSLSDISLDVAKNETSHFVKLIGRQISVSGTINFLVLGDTGNFVLSNVKINQDALLEK